MSEFFSGQGKLLIAPVVAGVPGIFRWMGNVPDFKIAFNTTKKEKKDSFTGQRLLLATMTTENKAKVTAELDEWSRENVALAVRGAASTVATGTVATGSPDVSPLAMIAGDYWALSHQNINGAVVVKDSAGTPATVDANHIEIDPIYGIIKIKNISTYVFPLKASYAYNGSTSIGFFTQPAIEVAFRFHGINTADNNRKCLAEVYRTSLDPTKELGLISDDYGKFSLEGDGLVDSTKNAEDPIFGPFGRIVYLT